jgi:hypothetical protein
MRFSPDESDKSYHIPSYLGKISAKEDVKIKVRRFVRLRGTVLATDALIKMSSAAPGGHESSDGFDTPFSKLSNYQSRGLALRRAFSI